MGRGRVVTVMLVPAGPHFPPAGEWAVLRAGWGSARWVQASQGAAHALRAAAGLSRGGVLPRERRRPARGDRARVGRPRRRGGVGRGRRASGRRVVRSHHVIKHDRSSDLAPLADPATVRWQLATPHTCTSTLATRQLGCDVQVQVCSETRESAEMCIWSYTSSCLNNVFS